MNAQFGAFFLTDTEGDGAPTALGELALIASYGYKKRKNVSNRFKPGEGLVGQAALEKKPILITEPPDDYIQVASGLGEAPPRNIIVLPVLFEEQVLGVMELALVPPVRRDDPARSSTSCMETIGVVLNTIIANMRTEELLQQSQSLTQELQSQSEELQSQQDELKRSNVELEEQAKSLKASEELLQTQQEELQQTNEELQEKAALLAQQNRDIEIKNREIELARASLEEKAEQLALVVEVQERVPGEHVARAAHAAQLAADPAKLLADNEDEQPHREAGRVRAARSTARAPTCSTLINDILDLSKVEAGKMDVHPADVRRRAGAATTSSARSGRSRSRRGSASTIDGRRGRCRSRSTTDEQRLQQVLKNLLSNAFKFTEQGGVTLRIEPRAEGHRVRVARSSTTRGRRDRVRRVATPASASPKDKQRLIFEAFQQADGTTSRKYGGTGLGPVDQPRDRAPARRRDPGRERRRARAARSRSSCPTGFVAGRPVRRARTAPPRRGRRRAPRPPRSDPASPSARSCRRRRTATASAAEAHGRGRRPTDDAAAARPGLEDDRDSIAARRPRRPADRGRRALRAHRCSTWRASAASRA